MKILDLFKKRNSSKKPIRTRSSEPSIRYRPTGPVHAPVFPRLPKDPPTRVPVQVDTPSRY